MKDVQASKVSKVKAKVPDGTLIKHTLKFNAKAGTEHLKPKTHQRITCHILPQTSLAVI